MDERGEGPAEGSAGASPERPESPERLESPELPAPDGEGRTGHAGMRRAGPGTALAYMLIPTVGGSLCASLLLTDPGRVPWILIGGVFLAVGFFLVATPLARRSDQLRVTFFRRATELAILAGLTSVVMVVYTLATYLLFGWRQS